MAKINRSLAIVIGIDQYTHIPKLKNAGSDATELANVLKNNYGYEVLLLLDQNATKEKFNELLANLENKTIQFDNQSIQVEETDRVLFYFAGHGFAEEAQDSEDGKPAGYFMPQNAEDGNSSTWLSMQKLYEVFTNLDCHHLLMILDCCFAGRISWAGKGRNAARSRKLYQQSYDRFIKYQTEQIITSAAHDEKAQDSFRFGQRGDQNGHSPFAHLLLKVLQGNSDGGKDKFIEAIVEDKVITVHELFTYLQNQLGKVADGQTPALSQPRKYDQETGQYVFFKGEYIFPFPNFNPQDLIPLKLDESKNPYKGLASYEKEDSQLFYGRKRLIEDPKEGLLSKVSNHLLTVVLGTSGSGKSSLVKAGLIPALKLAQETGQQKWVFLETMRPGESPFNALNQILTPSGSDSSEFSSLNYQEKVKSISNDIAQVISPDAKLLLVIDQAEELFTLYQNQEERTEFINLLAQLLTTYQQQLRIVLTLRSEFEPQIRDALKEPDWQKVWQDGRFIVTPMDREELQQAIEEPAAQRALFFESPKLVNDLIDEVVQMPGALPLLSFTLSELYLKYLKAEEKLERNDRTITEADYKKIGGVTRSLTQTADKTYNKLVEEQVDEPTIRDVMLRMVAISGGELARRRVPTSELEYPEPKNEQAKKVIDRFLEARLLVKGLDTENQEYVEPAHDALVRGWTKLREWIDRVEKTSNSLSLQQRLTMTAAAHEWDKNQKQENWKAYLWNSNPYLTLLEKMVNSDDSWLNQLEMKFVRCSIRKRDEEDIKEKKQIISILCRTSEALFASNQRLEALVEALKAGKELKQLQNKYPFWEDKDYPECTEVSAQVRGTLMNALYQANVRNRLEAHRGKVSSVAFSPDGQQIVTGGDIDRMVRLWNKSGKLLHEFEADETYAVERVIFSPDSQQITTQSSEAIRLWDTSGNLLHEFKGAGFGAVAISPDGQQIAALRDDGIIRLWDTFGNLLSEFKAYEEVGGGVRWTLVFSPDGQQIAVGTDEGSVHLWNISGKRLCEFAGLQYWVTRITFSPDGQQIAALGDQGSMVYLWDISSNPLIKFQGAKYEFRDIVFNNSDSQQIAIVGSDSIRLWSTKPYSPIAKLNFGKGILESEHFDTLNKLEGYKGLFISNVDFSPDGQYIAIGAEDGSVCLWDTLGQPLMGLQKLDSQICGRISNLVAKVSFSPERQQIATGTEDGSVCLWDTSGQFLNKFDGFKGDVKSVGFDHDSKLLVALENNSTISLVDSSSNLAINFKNSDSRADTPPTKCNIYSFAFSPDGQQIITGGFHNDICVWDASGNLLSKFDGALSEISGVAFSPDGQQIITGGIEGNARLWDISGNFLGELTGGSFASDSVAFSPDGQQIATGSSLKGQNVRLWDRSGKLLAEFNVRDSVYSVAFSPDGLQIATRSDDGSVFLWLAVGDIDQLILMSCNWVRDYLENNPKVRESDRHFWVGCPKLSENFL